jgi:hypothetical protein
MRTFVRCAHIQAPNLGGLALGVKGARRSRLVAAWMLRGPDQPPVVGRPRGAGFDGRQLRSASKVTGDPCRVPAPCAAQGKGPSREEWSVRGHDFRNFLDFSGLGPRIGAAKPSSLVRFPPSPQTPTNSRILESYGKGPRDPRRAVGHFSSPIERSRQGSPGPGQGFAGHGSSSSGCCFDFPRTRTAPCDLVGG